MTYIPKSRFDVPQNPYTVNQYTVSPCTLRPNLAYATLKPYPTRSILVHHWLHTAQPSQEEDKLQNYRDWTRWVEVWGRFFVRNEELKDSFFSSKIEELEGL